MADDRPTPFELFNAALESYRRGDVTEAVLLLRAGFFENLYVAPALLGDEFHPQRIWHAGPAAEPHAAREYLNRYGRLWHSQPESLRLLREVWDDSLVRAELRRFMGLSKNLLQAASDAEFDDLMRERELFLNPDRLRRTQSEILARIRSKDLRLPHPRPRLGLLLLAARDPGASVEFYRKLLELEPRRRSHQAGGYAEFDVEGVALAIHGQARTAAEDPYGLGPPPSSFGWGAILVFRVAEFDRYYRNVISAGIETIDSDLSSRGGRFFVVKDPSGYLVEITEEDPRGLQEP